MLIISDIQIFLSELLSFSLHPSVCTTAIAASDKAHYERPKSLPEASHHEKVQSPCTTMVEANWN